MPIISVIIPTYQRRESLRRTLRALERQTVSRAQFEVVVSIDGATDGTHEMVESFRAPFELRAICRSPNRGRAAACNEGIRHARGSLVAMLDDDMEPHPGWLAAHMARLAVGGNIGVVGPVPVACGSGLTAAQRYVAAKFDRHLRNVGERGLRIEGRAFYSGNFSIAKARLVEAGGYDETFAIYGNEDVELAVRLRRSGTALVYEPHALATQHYDKSMADLAHDQLAKGRTTVLLARMHPETVSASKLVAYDRASRRWRLARRVLLTLARIWPSLPDSLVDTVEWLDRRGVKAVDRAVPLVCDFYFWLGVFKAHNWKRFAYATRGAAVSPGAEPSAMPHGEPVT